MKFFLLSVAAAFDHEMISMLRDHEKPTIVEVEYQFDKPIDPRVERMSEVLMKHQEDAYPEACDDCKKCIEQTVKCWYHVAFQKMEDWCSKESKCPVQKRICRMFHKEPEVFAGILFVWGKPVDAGYFYCMGKGTCKPPKNAFMPTASWGPDFGESFDVREWDEVKDKEPVTEMELFQTEAEIEEMIVGGELQMLGDDNTENGDFKKCVKKASCWVMKHVIKQICNWCKKATKDSDKKKCEWLKAHKKFTFGALLAAVQPWKYAEGYCYQDHKKSFNAITSGFMQRLNAMSNKIQHKEEEFQS